MKTQHRNLLEIHLAVLLFGAAGLFGKLIGLPALIIVLGRVLFASISLFILFRFRKTNVLLKHKADYLKLFCLGGLLALHWFSFFHSIQLSTVAIGLLTFATFPVFVTFLEPVFFREKLYFKHIIAAILVFVGVAILVPGTDLKDPRLQGILWGLLSGFSFALLSLFNRSMVRKVNSLVIAFYQDLSATFFLIPALFFIKFELNSTDLLLLILLGVVFTALAHSLFINGLKTIKARLAALVAALEPVYGIFLAMLFIHEIPSVKTILGGLLILLVNVWINISEIFHPRIIKNR